MKVAIKAIEYYLPERSEKNEELLADNPKWDLEKILERTGVASRRVAKPGQCASDLGVEAANKLVRNHKIDKKTIGALIFCTQSPDYFLPTTACIMQDRLGLDTSCAAFDINLGCSGYIYGLSIAGSMIESGLFPNAILVCADTYTKFISKTDRTCRPIFGDGAAATLITKSDKDTIGPFMFGTDGRGAEHLIVSGGGMRNRDEKAVIKMDGPDVFMFTMAQIPKDIDKLLTRAGKKLEDIDIFFFHQASRVVLDNITRRISIPEKKVYRKFENIGNTVSASIPIALKQACDEKRLKPGDLIMLVGFGVGYSWGGCIVRWKGI